MELPQETEDYIRQSINHSVGLDIPTETLLLKLRAFEENNLHLRNQNLSLQCKLKEKDEVVERARAEANINAVALKKFVEENQKLASECSNLLASCNKLENECSLYDHDREALMDFGNEADERAKEAEIRNHELEEENEKLKEELHLHKFQSENRQLVDVPTDDLHMEQILLDSLLNNMFGKDMVPPTAPEFLEIHSSDQACQQLVQTWSSLRPLTQKVLALAAEAKKLEKDKDHLTINLRTAEEEVDVLFEENKLLDDANKRLMRQYYQEKHMSGSGGKHTGSASTKAKQRCSPKMSSPVRKKVTFGDVDSQRQPLSPLPYNSPDSQNTMRE